LIFIAISDRIWRGHITNERNKNMSSSLNIQLTNELRRYIDMRASDNDVYSTPSEYIRDLVRRDMEDWAIVSDVMQGLKEMKQGKFAPESIIDILNED
jgi:antitoxin ParD1/3/4